MPDDSGWTLDTLLAHLTERSDLRDRALSVALEAQLRQHDALRAQLVERLVAQQDAVAAALASAERAVDKQTNALDIQFHEHLVQYRDEVRVAMVASERAIAKSEMANEKRFESVNEFRGQLNDQARTFMPRQEALTLHERSAERISELTDRINRNEGRSGGYSALYGWAIAGIGLLISVVLLANAFLGK